MALLLEPFGYNHQQPSQLFFEINKYIPPTTIKKRNRRIKKFIHTAVVYLLIPETNELVAIEPSTTLKQESTLLVTQDGLQKWFDNHKVYVPFVIRENSAGLPLKVQWIEGDVTENETNSEREMMLDGFYGWNDDIDNNDSDSLSDDSLVMLREFEPSLLFTLNDDDDDDAIIEELMSSISATSTSTSTSTSTMSTTSTFTSTSTPSTTATPSTPSTPSSTSTMSTSLHRALPKCLNCKRQFQDLPSLRCHIYKKKRKITNDNSITIEEKNKRLEELQWNQHIKKYIESYLLLSGTIFKLLR